MADMLMFNVAMGAQEAVIHGYQDGFLKTDDYNNLTQCDTLSDLKSQLQVTDFGNFLQNESNLTSRIIADKALGKLVTEFDEVRGWAEQPLAQFLDFIAYEYMLSNVLKIITSARSNSASLEMLAKAHPLGVFEGMSALTASTTVEEMFATVLVDTPIGRFFNPSHIRDLDELSIEYVRAILQKNYLEAFYEFCMKLGGETAVVMGGVLSFEADRLVLTTARNTCAVGDLAPEDRKRMFPDFGSLADMHDEIAVCESVEQIVERLKVSYPEYADVLDEGRGGGLEMGAATSGPKTSSMEKKLTAKAVEIYKDAMARQFQYGIFYGWVKLRELEVQNLLWIGECITQSNKTQIQDYVQIA